jgi:hypothetical protein
MSAPSTLLLMLDNICLVFGVWVYRFLSNYLNRKFNWNYFPPYKNPWDADVAFYTTIGFWVAVSHLR